MWTDPGNIQIAHRHMNVEIVAEAAQFPEKEYINGIFVAVQLRFTYFHKLAKLSPPPSPSPPIEQMKRRGGAPCCRGAGTTTMLSGRPRPSPWRRKRELGRTNHISTPLTCKENLALDRVLGRLSHILCHGIVKKTLL